MDGGVDVQIVCVLDWRTADPPDHQVCQVCHRPEKRDGGLIYGWQTCPILRSAKVCQVCQVSNPWTTNSEGFQPRALALHRRRNRGKRGKRLPNQN